MLGVYRCPSPCPTKWGEFLKALGRSSQLDQRGKWQSTGKKRYLGLAQWLRIGAARTEEQRMAPSTHVGWLTTPGTPSPGGSDTTGTCAHAQFKNSRNTSLTSTIFVCIKPHIQMPLRKERVLSPLWKGGIMLFNVYHIIVTGLDL